VGLVVSTGRSQRHPNAPPSLIEECILIDTAFASWLLACRMNKVEAFDLRMLRSAWRTAWVEGVIRERQRTETVAGVRINPDGRTDIVH
jgi:hypothetical protein